MNDLIVGRLWGGESVSGGRAKTASIKVMRLIYVSVAEFSEGQLILRAMALAYMTLLSFVPLVAVSFSVLKAFGVHHQVEPLLYNFFLPLGPMGKDLVTRVLEFVGNMKVGVLGSVGLVLLVYIVVSLIHEVEEAFNYIWKIRKPRSFARRFSDYMSIILVGPVFIFSAIGLTASIMSTTFVQRIVAIQVFGMAVSFAGKTIPYIFVCFAFTFVYIFIPNIKVKFSSAFVGGLIAGIIWETTGWIFASFVVSSARYTAVYSGFAILMLFILWLYISWLILLVGAKVSFYHCYPQFLTLEKGELRLSNRLREKLTLMIIYLVGYNHYNNLDPWRLGSLVCHLHLPVGPVQDVLNAMRDNGFIMETGDDPAGYLPARDISTIRLGDLISTVRGTVIGDSVGTGDTDLTSEVESIAARVDEAINSTFAGMTVRDMVASMNRR